MVQRKKCRSRQELSDEYLLAKVGFDTAEKEGCTVCDVGVSRVYSLKKSNRGGPLWTTCSAVAPQLCNGLLCLGSGQLCREPGSYHCRELEKAQGSRKHEADFANRGQ